MVNTRCPTSSVGTIDGLGIRYGLTMNAWISSASATATATVMTSSIRPFMTDLGAPALGRRMTEPLEESDPVGRPVGENALPMIHERGTGPQKRLSSESGRLSPIM